ncbi:hypothetical protein [Metallosphaera hakonensis]|uniref:Uncharacterized protein n=1 Tax=Metallosphaera hakonensis JCM 8857 = DSM 7519 TaxID=1293036 RepID=A0A2U9IRQ0_9CREN|nr:hypothetical protein [Metallosphaera hakonensis]AWR98657.1 hypothetical protein DFR87_01895 [Metallosphaera hakonensis JCM 8857 = DSM 7519]
MGLAIAIRDEDKDILKRMHERVDHVLSSHREYFDALKEFDKTGVLKIRGKILYVRRYQETEDGNLNLQ